MIDINELRRLTQAALAGPDGISMNWIKLLQDFQQKASPSAVSELLDRLEAAEKERDKYKTAYNEWCEKSEWIQEGINNREISPKYLGWHLADIALDLLNGHKEMCVALQAKLEQMERQAPVGEIQRANSTGNYICSEVWVPLPVGSKLYALPGAQGEEK